MDALAAPVGLFDSDDPETTVCHHDQFDQLCPCLAPGPRRLHQAQLPISPAFLHGRPCLNLPPHDHHHPSWVWHPHPAPWTYQTLRSAARSQEPSLQRSLPCPPRRVGWWSDLCPWGASRSGRSDPPPCTDHRWCLPPVRANGTRSRKCRRCRYGHGPCRTARTLPWRPSGLNRWHLPGLPAGRSPGTPARAPTIQRQGRPGRALPHRRQGALPHRRQGSHPARDRHPRSGRLTRKLPDRDALIQDRSPVHRQTGASDLASMPVLGCIP